MKLDDIPFEIRYIEKEMPLFTDNTAKIPYSFSQGMPKDVNKVAYKVDDKFLNRHVSVIEEIAYKFPNHPLPTWMKRYQNKYFQANLAHDGFFKNTIDESMFFKKTRHFFTSNSYAVYGKVNGATLESGASPNTNQAGNNNALVLGKATGGVIGQYYNELANNITTGGVGNVNYACYDQVAGVATNLLGTTNGFACPASSSFTFHTTTAEFYLTSTTIWLGANNDNATIAWRTFSGVGDGEYEAIAYNGSSQPNPFSPTSTSYSQYLNMKVAHT